MTVSAYDDSELTYQWYKGGKEIEGATGTTYSIPSVTETATYKFRVIDVYGNSRSVYFYVTVVNKANQTYYVRIRTYKTVGKTKYCSAWSAAKTVKITK